jgi:CBS domain-containing protein
VQVRDVMTRDVLTVGPQTSAKYAAELMATHGFAAIPVVDDQDHVLGIVAEADVLRDRLPEDPRLHLRRTDDAPHVPPLLVEGVMTRDVRTVETTADLADVTRLVLEHQLRSLPVVDGTRLVGIVSRRDLLRALVRSDEAIRADLLVLVERYTGDPGCWEVDVQDGVATIRRTRGEPDGGPAVEERALTALAHTIGGVVGVRVLAPAGGGAGR